MLTIYSKELLNDVSKSKIRQKVLSERKYRSLLKTMEKTLNIYYEFLYGKRVIYFSADQKPVAKFDVTKREEENSKAER